jgi:hypothetical protein
MAGGYLRNHGIRGWDDTAVHVASRRTLSPSVCSAFDGYAEGDVAEFEVGRG